jgi:Leucine-rich repeat (LRR) protein
MGDHGNSYKKKAKQNPKELLELHLYDSNVTSLFEIRGLNAFTNLKSLNLHSNSITKIANLTQLLNLRELNLSSNRIQVIEGLDALSNLEILNLASNKVSEESTT